MLAIYLARVAVVSVEGQHYRLVPSEDFVSSASDVSQLGGCTKNKYSASTTSIFEPPEQTRVKADQKVERGPLITDGHIGLILLSVHHELGATGADPHTCCTLNAWRCLAGYITGLGGLACESAIDEVDRKDRPRSEVGAVRTKTGQANDTVPYRSR